LSALTDEGQNDAAARGFAGCRLRFVIAGRVRDGPIDGRVARLSVVKLPANSCAAFTQR
jgi:hypothetical protein